MDYFNDVFTNFLGLELIVAVYVWSESSQILSKILSLTGLKQHEDE